jgi:hypothetical protein
VARQSAQVELEAIVWRRLDAAAAAQGRSRDEVLEDSVRRSLAADALREVFARVRERGGPDEEEALAVAQHEKTAWRQQRRAGSGAG